MLIDSHVNLHHEAFEEDRDEALSRARAAGVGRFITICDRLENLDRIATIAAAHSDIWMSAGVHPHYAKDVPDLTADQLASFARSNPKIVAIGETGLDQYYNHSPIEAQLKSFRAHLAAAQQTDLPVIVHTRDADPLTAEALESAAAQQPIRILMHCYTSGMELAERAWALGAYMSFSGIMTFKSADAVRAVAMAAPLDRVIFETDCPYLAPIPHRGRRNEPAFVADVYDAFARLRGLSRDSVVDLAARNFFTLFSRVPA